MLYASNDYQQVARRKARIPGFMPHVLYRLDFSLSPLDLQQC
jgi:hypothetical protein